jgi:hypothetical protein
MFVYSEALGGGLLVVHDKFSKALKMNVVVCFINYGTDGSEKSFNSIFGTSLTI